jgi:hypothetical protein
VAESGNGTAGLHRREKVALEREVGVADGVDAQVERMQAPASDAVVDGTAGKTAQP